MIETPESDRAERPCGFCGQPFSYPRGAHRPPAYCSRVWDSAPRTCQARAKARRMANRAAGLDAPLETMREDSGQVLPAIEALREVLDGYAVGVREVETAALARAAEAEREMQEAMDRAETEAQARARAERAQAAAETARAEALDARRTAERLARDAGRQAEDRVNAAWRTTIEHEAARAAAEQKASEQTAAAVHAIEARRAAEQQLRETRDRNAGLDKDLAVARTQLTAVTARAETAEARAGALVDELGTARAQVERQAGDLEQLRGQLTGEQAAHAGTRELLAAATARIEAAEARASVLVDERDLAAAQLATARDDSEQLRTQLAEARAARAAAEATAAAERQRAERAEARQRPARGTGKARHDPAGQAPT